jgi:hypothetical protein
MNMAVSAQTAKPFDFRRGCLAVSARLTGSCFLQVKQCEHSKARIELAVSFDELENCAFEKS